MHSSDPPRRGRGGFAPPGHHGSGSTPRATLSIDISLRCGFASPRMLIGSGVLRGRNVQRIPRKVVPWAAVALVTAMVAGGRRPGRGDCAFLHDNCGSIACLSPSRPDRYNHLPDNHDDDSPAKSSWTTNSRAHHRQRVGVAWSREPGLDLKRTA